MSDPAAPPPELDALLPPAMAAKAAAVGARKAGLPAVTTVTLGVLAGAFIALGGVFATTAGAGAGAWPWGIVRVVQGVCFSLGLILVLVGGAELFTGNTLLVMAWMSRRITLGALLRNWALVFAGNALGALGMAALLLVARQHTFGGGAVGAALLASAEAKCALAPAQAVALGTLCNVLVCLAVWLTFSARSTTDRIVAVVPPIAAFVAAGFEHSVANLFTVPLAIAVRATADERFWRAAGIRPEAFPHVNAWDFLVRNLLPVTVGNVLGGAALVGATYWYVYLRAER